MKPQREPARYDLISDFYLDVVGTDACDPTAATLLGPAGTCPRDASPGSRLRTQPDRPGLARRRGRVTGADISGNLLDKARAAEAAVPLGITYRKLDVTAEGALTGEKFDAVACNHGLDDIDGLDRALRTVARVLRPVGGSFSLFFTPSRGWTKTRRAAGRTAAATTQRAGGSPGTPASAAK